MEYISVTKMAKDLKVSRQAIQGLIDSGKLAAEKFADIYFIRNQEAAKWKSVKHGKYRYLELKISR